MEQTIYFSNQRAKISGNLIEISKFEKAILVGNYRIKSKEKDEKEKVPKEKLNSEEIREKSLKRARARIYDMVFSNVWQWKKRNGEPYMPIFITFTFRENITDLDFAHAEYTKFIKRLSYEIWGQNVNVLKYLAVVEFQGRGAIHYHVIFFNLPFMERIYDKMLALWGHGSANVKAIRSERGIARYLCKYLTKTIKEDRLQTRKSYFTSKGLKTPIATNIEEAVVVLESMLPEKLKFRGKPYETEYLGIVEKTYCNLRRYPKIAKLVKEEFIDKYIL
jgi:hypothetical protein